MAIKDDGVCKRAPSREHSEQKLPVVKQLSLVKLEFVSQLTLGAVAHGV